MAYCYKCGAEATSKFCPECGTKIYDPNDVSASSTPVTSHTPLEIPRVVYENVEIKPRFGAGHVLIAGYFGLCCLIASVATLVMGIIFLSNGEMSGEDLVTYPVGMAFLFFITFLCYLPGIIAIRKRSPKGEAFRTFLTFFGKSLICLFLWAITFISYVYILGIFLGAWRLGAWACRPKDDQYTAFVNGEKIPVTRCLSDTNYDGYVNVTYSYVYVDATGKIYYP